MLSTISKWLWVEERDWELAVKFALPNEITIYTCPSPLGDLSRSLIISAAASAKFSQCVSLLATRARGYCPIFHYTVHSVTHTPVLCFVFSRLPLLFSICDVTFVIRPTPPLSFVKCKLLTLPFTYRSPSSSDVCKQPTVSLAFVHEALIRAEECHVH